MLRKSLLAIPILLAGLVAGQAMAQTYAGPGGTGYGIASTAQPCVGATVAGCAYVAAFLYSSADGSPVVLAGKTSQLDADTINVSSIGLTIESPTATTASAARNGSISNLTLLNLNSTEPFFFNAIRDGFYSAEGETSPSWYLASQGEKVFAISIVGTSWYLAGGQLIINRQNATSRFEGARVRFKADGSSTPIDTRNITLDFVRNTQVQETINGVTRTLRPFAY